MNVRCRANGPLSFAALFACMLLLAGCSGGGHAASSAVATPELRDPSAAGPYGVGLTKMTFTSTDTAGAARPLETWIWYPADPALVTPQADAQPATAGGPFPVVIFSHGSGGQPNFYKFFAQHLASWGFVVAAPPHPGNTSADCFPCGTDSIIPSARERPGDVAFVLDGVLALKDDPAQPLGSIVDGSRTALAGHSFGGWTAIYAATSGKFGAIISMAPGLPETLRVRAGDIHVPVLLIGAGQDELIPPASVRKLYDALPGPDKFLLSLPEGHHTSFIDRCLNCTAALSTQRGQELINRYSTAFLETYVAADQRYAHYLSEDDAPDAVFLR